MSTRAKAEAWMRLLLGCIATQENINQSGKKENWRRNLPTMEKNSFRPHDQRKQQMVVRLGARGVWCGRTAGGNFSVPAHSGPQAWGRSTKKVREKSCVFSAYTLYIYNNTKYIYIYYKIIHIREQQVNENCGRKRTLGCASIKMKQLNKTSREREFNDDID